MRTKDGCWERPRMNDEESKVGGIDGKVRRRVRE